MATKIAVPNCFTEKKQLQLLSADNESKMAAPGGLSLLLYVT